ncbi:hypothetical protein HDU87_002366 [Geranomyces variabilis]|uniref:ELMO domain-containing protein n=1 Tax=Geranomyces variabilis TaxID=109894 RepID=A0AAD5XN78_9FUNG|nr:hypothetical protein HDU87_002366 [Geranomyces variabilis]
MAPEIYRATPARQKRRITVSIAYKHHKLEAYSLDTSASVSSIIKGLWLSHFSLTGNPSGYCLRVVETEELLTQDRLRRKLLDGANLKLVASPALMAADMIENLTPEDDQSLLKRTIFLLQKYLKEDEFVDEFIALGGLDKLQDIIITAQGNTLAYALTSLQTLMEHDRGWDSFSRQFISTLVSIIVKQNLVNICRPATAIIIKLVAANPSSPSSSIQCYGFDVVNRAISSQASFLPTLVHRLAATDYLLQLNSLHLINSLFRHVTDRARTSFVQMLDALKTRHAVMILMQSSPAEELKAQLIDYQRLLVVEGHRRRRAAVDLRNKEHAAALKDLWDLSGIQPPGAPPEWEKLGFSSTTPHRDLTRVGVLGLEAMHVFAQQETAAYQKLFSDQENQASEKRCPFVRAAVESCEIMAEHWEVSTGYSTMTSYQPLLLAFQQVFGITLVTFFRLWTEMDVDNTPEDVTRVSALVRSQFKHSASIIQPQSPTVVATFRSAMCNTPYAVVRERQLKNLEVEDQLLSKLPVRQLRERVYQQSYEAVKKQRIECLKLGAWFPVIGPKGRVKGVQRFYRLGPNHKFLHHGDFPEASQRKPGLDELGERIDMSLATDLLTGLASPTFSSKKNAAETPTLCFSLASSSSSDTAHPTMADFCCATSTQYSEWTDGFNMLLDKNIANRDTAEYIRMLTDVAVTIALLDLTGEGVDVVSAAAGEDAPGGGVNSGGGANSNAGGGSGTGLPPANAQFWYDDGAAGSETIVGAGLPIHYRHDSARSDRRDSLPVVNEEEEDEEGSNGEDEEFSEMGDHGTSRAGSAYDDDGDVDYDIGWFRI